MERGDRRGNSVVEPGATARRERSRQAHRSADRSHRLHRGRDRHQRGQAGAEKGQEQGRQGVCRGHAARPRGGQQALALVKKLNVTPEDNDTSKTLSKQASDKLAELDKLSGAAFDKAYVANEVAYHKAVNGALETQLIPSAGNAELKSLLQTGLKIFQGHQQHAEHVAAELK